MESLKYWIFLIGMQGTHILSSSSFLNVYINHNVTLFVIVIVLFNVSSGSGDVDMSKVVTADSDGCIIGASGSC